MTFSPEDYERRRARAVVAAGEAGLDGILVTPGPDLAYFTGYAPLVTERITLLALRAGAQPAMVVPRLERDGAEAAPGAGGIAFADWADGEDAYAAAAAVLGAGGRFAISDAAWALHVLGLQAAAPEARLTAMTDALPMLRAVKDAGEVERMAAAGAAADAAMEAIVRGRFAGRTERDVAADIRRLLREHGHAETEVIVGSGPNGANPHHEVSDRVLEPGDMVVMDFGGTLDGYCSDTTRTVCVGAPAEEARAVHEAVRRAQQAACEAVRPGATCEDVDRAAREVIARAGYGERFIHRTGHGIGLTIHEPPYVVAGERRALEPGMCFSVEPGVYLPGRFGVRIEDIVTVTEAGVRRFNATAHELRVVE